MEFPLPLTQDRDDRLFCESLEEEAAIRNDILFMKHFACESPLLPPANQHHTCHPECQRGISCLNLESFFYF
jgi:hypothetical protein